VWTFKKSQRGLTRKVSSLVILTFSRTVVRCGDWGVIAGIAESASTGAATALSDAVNPTEATTADLSKERRSRPLSGLSDFIDFPPLKISVTETGGQLPLE
jgi:hypothetical protein